MTRNLKALGLALVAAFAMSAIAASAAQADKEQFTLSAYPGFAHATAEQSIGEGDEYFEVNENRMECEVSHFESATISEGTEKLTVTPNYTDHLDGGNCRAGGIAKVTVDMTDCAYVFHKLVTQPSPATDYTTSVEIECPTGKVIDVTVNKLFSSTAACHITVPPQTAVGTLTVENMSPHDVTISGSVHVKVDIHNTHSILCGTETATEENVTAVYSVSAEDKLTVTGTNHNKTQNIGATVSHPA